MNFSHWSQCCWYCHGARSGRRERGDCDQCRDMCQCAGVASHRGAHAAPCQGWHLQHNTTGTRSRSRSSPPKGQCAGDSGLWQECQVWGVNTPQYTDTDIDSLWIQINTVFIGITNIMCGLYAWLDTCYTRKVPLNWSIIYIHEFLGGKQLNM